MQISQVYAKRGNWDAAVRIQTHSEIEKSKEKD